jgi:predicted  nucleic acid-binding Zn-ribbon protein
MAEKNENVMAELKKKIGVAKAKAAAVRDELRKLQYEVEEIANSFDDGCDALEDAQASLDEAVSLMSQYV